MAQGTKQPTPATTPRSAAAERRAERAAQAKREQARRRRGALLIGGVALLLLIGAGVLFLPGKLAEQQLISQARQLPAIPDEGRGHVKEGTPIAYKHYPPSSGTHYDVTQPAGVYTQEVPDGKFVHNLEHGYVVVLLKCPNGCPDLFKQFTDLYNTLPNSKFGTKKMVVTPYSHPFSDPSKEAPITLLAWDHEEMLQSFDKAKILAFYQAYVDRGPEDAP